MSEGKEDVYTKILLSRAIEDSPEVNKIINAVTIQKILTQLERQGLKLPEYKGFWMHFPKKRREEIELSLGKVPEIKARKIIAYYESIKQMRGVISATAKKFGYSTKTIGRIIKKHNK